MSFLSGLICVLFMSPAQGAPADVPKNHWAYGAVNELFENGLLKGYPAEGKALTLRSNVVSDMKKAQQRTLRWEREQILVTAIDAEFVNFRRDPSRYELAVGVYAVYWGRNALGEEKARQTLLKELPEIVDQIAMFQFELTKLGADPKQMVADLEQFRQKYEGRFQGGH